MGINVALFAQLEDQILAAVGGSETGIDRTGALASFLPARVTPRALLMDCSRSGLPLGGSLESSALLLKVAASFGVTSRGGGRHMGGVGLAVVDDELLSPHVGLGGSDVNAGERGGSFGKNDVRAGWGDVSARERVGSIGA